MPCLFLASLKIEQVTLELGCLEMPSETYLSYYSQKQQMF